MMRVAEDARPRTTKNVYVYKAGDRYFSGIRVPVNLRRYRTVDALLDDLTAKVPGLNRGARVLSTSRGKHSIQQLDQLEHLGSYLCSDRPPRVPRFDWKQIVSNPIEYQFRGNYRAAYGGNASKVIALNSTNEESASERPPSRAQSDPGNKPKRITEKHNSMGDKTLVPLDKSKLKHKQRIKVNVKKAWSPEDLPDFEVEANQKLKTNEKQLATKSTASPAASESILVSERKKAALGTSATSEQDFYQVRSKEEYGSRNDLQGSNTNEADEKEDISNVDNPKSPVCLQKSEKPLGMVAEWLAASQDEIPQADADEDDKERLVAAPNERSSDVDSISAQRRPESGGTSKPDDADVAAVEDEEGDAAHPVQHDEVASLLKVDSARKTTEDEIINESKETDAESALERRAAEDEEYAAVFTNTNENNEAAIKIQTAFRNRLAQKEAERRSSVRTAEAAPVAPLVTERPLSSYRPETGDSSSTFWPSTPLPGQV
uniref:Doublecortin domain-containing protein n=1 Tax=Plectus sambesii TaxID=2011161 RepID=A0A914WD54_9BILA